MQKIIGCRPEKQANGKWAFSPIYAPEEKQNPKPEQVPRMNADEREKSAKNNAVELDPLRLRSVYPDGVPGNPTVQEILREPKKWAEVWETLEYIFTGVKRYSDAHDRAIADLVENMTK